MVTALSRAKELALRKDAAPILLAMALAAAEDEAKGSIAEVISATTLKRRRAYYLLRVGRRFSQSAVPVEQLAAVGWTKLKVIAQHCPEGQEQAALSVASVSTADELERTLRTGSPTKQKHRVMLLRLTPQHHALLSAALIANGATPSRNGRGIDGKEQALVRLLGKRASTSRRPP